MDATTPLPTQPLRLQPPDSVEGCIDHILPFVGGLLLAGLGALYWLLG
jgi:hypothetical protein